MIRFFTAGESHGDCLIGILEGFPSNVYLDVNFINSELKRRQKGYGRSNRMNIEQDEVKILSGVSDNLTTGNPICLLINNRGREIGVDKIIRPRPGHGDLAGMLKYNQKDAKNVMERASARETAMRVAVGSICKLLLKEFDIRIYSHVIQIGNVKALYKINADEGLLIRADESSLRVLDKETEIKMIEEIERAKEEGDTLGGVFEVIGKNIPVGLGSYTSWDRRLDGIIAGAIMSIPGIKGIEFGIGFDSAKLKGSKVHDEIFYAKGYFRKTNNAGGIEAGISNGEDIVFRAVMKPIPTLRKPLKTVNIKTKEEDFAQFVRSDVCAVPSASVVAENMFAYVLANEMSVKFGGDSIEEMKANFNSYIDALRER